MDSAQFNKMYSQANDIMGPFADILLRQAGFPPPAPDEKTPSPLVVLDMACGSGVVASHVISSLGDDRGMDLDITCADISEAMISNVSRRIEESGWRNARAVVADAMDTKLPASHFSHIFFSFGPFILPDGLAGLRECHRILRPNSGGGVLGFTTWKHVPWVADYRAGMAMDPSLPSLPSDEEFLSLFSEQRWDDVEDVTKKFSACGFDDVEVQVAENTTSMSLEDVRAMLPYSLGIMVQTFWSKEDADKYQAKAGAAIIDYLRVKYAGGPVVWTWVAIIATGSRKEEA